MTAPFYRRPPTKRRLPMSRAPYSASRPRRGGTFRPQLEALDGRLPPGPLHGTPPPHPGSGHDGPDLALLAGIAAGQSHGATQTTSPVLNFADGSVAPGSSTLTRTENGVTIHL